MEHRDGLPHTGRGNGKIEVEGRAHTLPPVRIRAAAADAVVGALQGGGEFQGLPNRDERDGLPQARTCGREEALRHCSLGNAVPQLSAVLDNRRGWCLLYRLQNTLNQMRPSAHYKRSEILWIWGEEARSNGGKDFCRFKAVTADSAHSRETESDRH